MTQLRQGRDEIHEYMLRRDKHKAKCKIADLFILIRNLKKKQFDKTEAMKIQLSQKLQETVVKQLQQNIQK